MIREIIKEEITNIMKATQRYQIGLLDEDEYENKIYESARKIHEEEITITNYEKQKVTK